MEGLEYYQKEWFVEDGEEEVSIGGVVVDVGVGVVEDVVVFLVVEGDNKEGQILG